MQSKLKLVPRILLASSSGTLQTIYEHCYSAGRQTHELYQPRQPCTESQKMRTTSPSQHGHVNHFMPSLQGNPAKTTLQSPENRGQRLKFLEA